MGYLKRKVKWYLKGYLMNNVRYIKRYLMSKSPVRYLKGYLKIKVRFLMGYLPSNVRSLEEYLKRKVRFLKYIWGATWDIWKDICGAWSDIWKDIWRPRPTEIIQQTRNNLRPRLSIMLSQKAFHSVLKKWKRTVTGNQNNLIFDKYWRIILNSKSLMRLWI